MARIAPLAVYALLVTAPSLGAAPLVLDGPGGQATLHAGPDPLYDVIHTVSDGTSVETLDKTLTWTFVRAATGAVGWVPTAHLVAAAQFVPARLDTEIETSVLPSPRPPGDERQADVAPAAPDPDQPFEIEELEAYSSVVWPEDGRLNLRAGPGLSFDVLALMERGDWVSVSARAGPWVKVEHESGAKGWAYSEFLTQ
ncbi:MAG: SH3 domain-containing protein [Pseudomonadota bacterium]